MSHTALLERHHNVHDDASKRVEMIGSPIDTQYWCFGKWNTWCNMFGHQCAWLEIKNHELMCAYVLCWARCPAQNLRLWVQPTLLHFVLHNILFITHIRPLLQSALANKGFKVAFFRCSSPVIYGTCQPLTSRPSMEGLRTGVPMYFIKRCCWCILLGPLVPHATDILA